MLMKLYNSSFFILLALRNKIRYIKSNSILISDISDLLFREVTNNHLIFILESKKVREYIKSLATLHSGIFQDSNVIFSNNLLTLVYRKVKIFCNLNNFNNTIVNNYSGIRNYFKCIVKIYRWDNYINYSIVNIYNTILNIYNTLVNYYRPYLINNTSIVKYYRATNNILDTIFYFFNPIKLNGGLIV